MPKHSKTGKAKVALLRQTTARQRGSKWGTFTFAEFTTGPGFPSRRGTLFTFGTACCSASRAFVRYGSQADMRMANVDVRFVPLSGHVSPLQRTGFRRIGLPTIYTRGEGQEKAMTKQVGAVIEIRSDSTGLFVIFDGVKIAKRGPPGTPQAGTWVSLEPGCTVLDHHDVWSGEMAIEIAHEGVRVH